jgi:esterase/lipase
MNNKKEITRNDLKNYFLKKGNVVISKKETKTCFLLLHGLNASLDIFDNLINNLSKEINADFYIPIQRFSLNSSFYNTKKNNKNLWIKDIILIYKKLNKYYKNIYVVGHSLGGVITINVSFKLKLKSIILISTPIIVDLKLLFTSTNKFNKVPFNIKLNVISLIFKNKNLISKIKSNILYCLGLDDETISINSIKKIEQNYNNIKDNIKLIKINYFENCNHSQILKNPVFAEELYLKIIGFLKSEKNKLKQSFKKQK